MFFLQTLNFSLNLLVGIVSVQTQTWPVWQNWKLCLLVCSWCGWESMPSSLSTTTWSSWMTSGFTPGSCWEWVLFLTDLNPYRAESQRNYGCESNRTQLFSLPVNHISTGVAQLVCRALFPVITIWVNVSSEVDGKWITGWSCFVWL